MTELEQMKKKFIGDWCPADWTSNEKEMFADLDKIIEEARKEPTDGEDD